MTPIELLDIKNRVQKYEQAERDVLRYERIQRTLEAITGDGDQANSREDGIGSIVVDVVKGEFRYVPARLDDGEVGSRICSLEKADHEQFFTQFLEWARQTISLKIHDAKSVMDQA